MFAQYATIPTAVAGLTVARGAGVLPSTGVAVGLYVVVGLGCIVAGLLLRWKAARLAARAG